MQVPGSSQRLIGVPIDRVVKQHQGQVVGHLVGPVDQQPQCLVLRSQVAGCGWAAAIVHRHPSTPGGRIAGGLFGPATHLVGAHHAPVSDPHHVLVPDQHVGMFDDQSHGRRGGQSSPLCRVQIAPVQLPVHPELQERPGFFDGGP